MEQEHCISGECKQLVYFKKGDPCFGCALCSIDGNDYSDMGRSGKPFDDVPGF